MAMCFECKEKPTTHRIVSPKGIYRLSYCEPCARALMEKYNEAIGDFGSKWRIEERPVTVTRK